MFLRHVLLLLTALQSVQPHGLQTGKFIYSRLQCQVCLFILQFIDKVATLLGMAVAGHLWFHGAISS